MYSLTIQKIEKTYFQAENGDVLEVTVELTNGEITEERKIAYPLATTEEELQNELQKYLESYNAEQEAKVANAERDELYAQADQTIENLTGVELTVNNEEEEE